MKLIKVFLKFSLPFLTGMARHAQSTQNHVNNLCDIWRRPVEGGDRGSSHSDLLVEVK